MKATDLRAGNVVGKDALNVYPPNFIAGIVPLILSEIKEEAYGSEQVLFAHSVGSETQVYLFIL